MPKLVGIGIFNFDIKQHTEYQHSDSELPPMIVNPRKQTLLKKPIKVGLILITIDNDCVIHKFTSPSHGKS